LPLPDLAEIKRAVAFHRRLRAKKRTPLLDVRDANSKPREHPGEGADVHHHD
jgi:hypothetical protein